MKYLKDEKRFMLISVISVVAFILSITNCSHKVHKKPKTYNQQECQRIKANNNYLLERIEKLESENRYLKGLSKRWFNKSVELSIKNRRQ